MKIQMTKGA